MASPEHGTVEIRAFRGTRKASTYHEHTLAEASFVRILAAGAEHELEVLPSLDARGSHELDKERSRALARDVEGIRGSAELLDLDDDLTAIAEVARWCGRAPGEAWLRIVRP
jgi:hypothetical protein